MSWVDAIVLLLAVIAGVSGWRHGMAVALLSFVGVLGGAIIGVRLAPLLAAGVEYPTTRIMVSIAVVVLLVALGETTGVFFGRRIRDRITGTRSLQLDSTLGSLLQAITVVLAAWLVALPLASASFPGLVAGVRGSEVLRAVDSVMPASAKRLPVGPAPAAQQLRLPGRHQPVRADPDHPGRPAQPGPAEEPGGDRRGRQRAQDPRPGPVLLAAAGGHRVRDRPAAGDDQRARGRRHRGDRGRGDQPARPHRRAGRPGSCSTTRRPTWPCSGCPTWMPTPLNFQQSPASAGDDVLVLGYPLDGPFTATAGKIRQLINLKGPNIYDTGEITRQVYTVRAVVRSGNSGGPMIDPEGRVVGVVFGAALDDQETGFVLTVEQVSAALQSASQLTRAVDTGSCAA